MHENTLILGTGAYYFHFNTKSAAGAPITLAGTPSLALRKNGSTTATAGLTLTVDYNDGGGAHTGEHRVALDVDNATLALADGDMVEVFIAAGTVDGVSVANTVIARFAITDGSLLAGSIADIADGVWDETIDYTAHATLGTAGRQLKDTSNTLGVERIFTVVGWGSSFIQFGIEANPGDDKYNGWLVRIIPKDSTTGVGQVRRVTNYVGSTRTATITPNWTTFGVASGAMAQLYHPDEIGAIWDMLVADHALAGSFGEEVATHALSTEIAALQDLSQADAQVAATAALNAYDPPTKAEMDAGFAGITVDAATIADAVWNENLSDHTILGSSGRRLLLSTFPGLIHGGVPPNGTAGASWFRLASDASAVDEYYTGAYLVLLTNVAGKPGGEVKKITEYLGATKVATVDSNFSSIPSPETPYMVISPTYARLIWGAQLGDNSESGSFGEDVQAKLAAIEADTTVLPTDIEVATAVWDLVIEAGYSAEQLLRGMVAILLGRVSGSELNAPVFRDLNNTKDRVSATVDSEGNRTAISLDDLS